MLEVLGEQLLYWQAVCTTLKIKVWAHLKKIAKNLLPAKADESRKGQGFSFILQNFNFILYLDTDIKAY